LSIVTIQGGLDALFRDDSNVFVAGDLLWYPVEGNNTIRTAPDVMVVFGRPKGHRGSYRQWEEGGIAPQVIFEVLSPGNRFGENLRKFRFYEHYGVEEYYVYEPDHNDLSGWQRSGDELVEIPVMESWVSPRLKTRFQSQGGDLEIYSAGGRKFATYVELAEQREEAQERAERLAAQLRKFGVEPEA
jgi:hypothetical protein